MRDLPRHRSITHLHLFAVINTLLDQPSRIRSEGPIRVLDIGCGDGWLMRYLVEMFAFVRPGQTVEVYGFDVHEHGYGAHEEFERAVRNLASCAPEVDWRAQIKAISVEDMWPYPEEFFDVAVSNQVLEHVADAQAFFASVRRVLKPDGFSVHLFPVSQIVFEGHVKIPLAHWIRDVELQQALISTSNRVGIGRWKLDRRIFNQTNLAEYARSQSSYLNTSTFYRSFSQFFSICNANGLDVSYHYTKNFYTAKLRDLAGRAPRLHYGSPNSIVELLSFLALRYVSGITLLVRPLAYDTAGRKHAEKSLADRVEA